jgi:uncharacterized repeat protein (TIGR04042 family)
MPEMLYRLRWPDRTETECYSPSLVIREFFEAGAEYDLEEFLRRVREATAIASERVRAKYGQPCSRALAQLGAIEDEAQRFVDQEGARVVMLSFTTGQ